MTLAAIAKMSEIEVKKRVLTGRHDDPVRAIPAVIKCQGCDWKIPVRNALSGVLVAIAIFLNHDCFALLHLNSHDHKPILCADLPQMAHDGVHDPATHGFFSKIMRAISQQVFWSESVIAFCTRELRQLRLIVCVRGIHIALE